MAEIMLALDGNNFRRLSHLDKETLGLFSGVKILASETYRYDGRRIRQPHPFVGSYARAVGASAVMLDTRFSYDKSEEAVESTRAAISEMRSYKPKRAQLARFSRKPDFITIHHDVPEATIKAFANTALDFGVTPVCYLTSSRFSERDYKLRGVRKPLDSAKYLAEFISNEESAVESVICAAADARVIKEVNPDLTVFATGALLSADEETGHERPALLQETAPYVDVFIMGSAILWADDPQHATYERFDALAA